VSVGKRFLHRTRNIQNCTESVQEIVISNIAASYGSIAVITEDLDGCVVSSEYTILKALPPYKPEIVHLVLRSPEVRADILLASTGINRTRVRWELIQDLIIPYPEDELVAQVLESIKNARHAKQVAMQSLLHARQLVEEQFDLRNETALGVLAAFKPPK